MPNQTTSIASEFVADDEFLAIEAAMAMQPREILRENAQHTMRHRSDQHHPSNMQHSKPSMGTLSNGSSSNTHKHLPYSESSSSMGQKRPASAMCTTQSGASQVPQSFQSQQAPNSARQVKSKFKAEASDGVEVRFEMIGRDDFAAHCRYNSSVVELFKSIPGRQYDPKRRAWLFQMQHHEKLAAILEASANPVVVVQRLPASVQERLGGSSLQQSSSLPVQRQRSSVVGSSGHLELENVLSRAPAAILQCLLPFQRESICFAIQRQGRLLIGDEMGLGKTLQAIALSSCYPEDWPLLIVCPASLRLVWKAEIVKWRPDLPQDQIHVVMSSKDGVTGRVCIINYDVAIRMQEKLIAHKFGVCVYDESHYLKNHQSQRTKVMKMVASKAKRVLLLTGTPALAKPIELFTQIQMVQPKLFTNRSEFGNRYCAPQRTHFGMKYDGSSNTSELYQILSEKVMIRRLKKDVLTELPDKLRSHVPLQLSTKQMKNISSLMQELQQLDQLKNMGDEAAGNESQRILNQAVQETGLAKLKTALEYIHDLLESSDANQKFIVFAHHIEVLDGISDALQEWKVSFVACDGRTPALQRQQRLEEFQNKSAGPKVAVLGITAVGTGVTLTAANVVVFAELHWTPGTVLQAEDRAHRIGQSLPVTIQYLVAKGTADDIMWKALQSRFKRVSSMLNGEEEDSLSAGSHRVVKASGINSSAIIPQLGIAKQTGPMDNYLTDKKSAVKATEQGATVAQAAGTPGKGSIKNFFSCQGLSSGSAVAKSLENPQSRSHRVAKSPSKAPDVVVLDSKEEEVAELSACKPASSPATTSKDVPPHVSVDCASDSDLEDIFDV